MHRLCVCRIERKTSQAVKKRGKSMPPILLGLLVGKRKGGGAVWERDHSAWCDCLELLVQVEVLGGRSVSKVAGQAEDRKRCGVWSLLFLAGVTSTLCYIKVKEARPSSNTQMPSRRGAEQEALNLTEHLAKSSRSRGFYLQRHFKLWD